MKKGFTLIELLIYVSLVGAFVAGAILFTWDVIYSREKTFQKNVVDQSIRSSMARIGYEIRRAENIDSVSSSSISLINSDETITTISLLNEAIEISPSGTGPYQLTSNQVRVTQLEFIDLSSDDQNSKNIQVEVTMEAVDILPGQIVNPSSARQAIELNSQFNYARQLLIDLSGATYTGSNRLTNAKIRNIGDEDFLIDKLIIYWTNSVPTEAITEVQIAGGTIEWAGSAASGEEIDIVDFLLPASSPQEPINHMQFNSNVDGETIYITFVLSDGSSASGSIVLGQAQTSSCLEYCASLEYSSGLCRRRPQQCSDNAEINETGGDQYCTSPPDDTCCCQL